MKLIYENNSVNILTAAEKVNDDTEGSVFNKVEDSIIQIEAQNEDSEEEDDSGDETDDLESEILSYSCPFCMGVFKEKTDVIEHIDMCQEL